MRSWTSLGSFSLTSPSWSSAYLRRKNTFIELVPPLSESVLGFEMWRRQTSAPTVLMVGSTAREEDGTDLHDRRTARDSAAAEKPALAIRSPCSGQESVAAQPASVVNPSWKNLSLDESLAGCYSGCLQTLDEKLADFSVRRRRMSKASGITEATTEMSTISPATTSKEGRSFSKLGGVTEATSDVGSTGPKDQEGLQDRRKLMYSAGSEPARIIQTKGLSAAVASVPLNEGRPTSLGSFGHAVGTCRPCVHSSSPKGCDSGVLCRFCHFDHPGIHKAHGRARPCKGKRDRYRKLLGKLVAQVDEDPTSFSVNDDRLPPSIKFDPRMKAKLSAIMSGHAQKVRRQQEAVAHVMAMPR